MWAWRVTNMEITFDVICEIKDILRNSFEKHFETRFKGEFKEVYNLHSIWHATQAPPPLERFYN